MGHTKSKELDVTALETTLELVMLGCEVVLVGGGRAGLAVHVDIAELLLELLAHDCGGALGDVWGRNIKEWVNGHRNYRQDSNPKRLSGWLKWKPDQPKWQWGEIYTQTENNGSTRKGTPR
ncbi:unnamed protein product [Clonostachys solani]|uniref:Uncharacterized protein n=1 Tax=Clonostachys solani TaxID=160281 RepID=A0A9N9ZJA0_9HYPO|nr:unnamed protein product [Clonostachys solani]